MNLKNAEKKNPDQGRGKFDELVGVHKKKALIAKFLVVLSYYQWMQTINNESIFRGGSRN
jgi:hypothetical protein